MKHVADGRRPEASIELLYIAQRTNTAAKAEKGPWPASVRMVYWAEGTT